MSVQDELGEFEQTLPQNKDLTKDFDRQEQEEILDNITPTQNNTTNYSSTPPQHNIQQIEVKSSNQNQTQSETKDRIHIENIQTDPQKIAIGDNVSQSDKTNFSDEQFQEEQSFSAWGQLNDQVENVELGQGQGQQAGQGYGVQGQGQVQDEIDENVDDWEGFGEFEAKPSFENDDQISKPVRGLNSPTKSTSQNIAGENNQEVWQDLKSEETKPQVQQVEVNNTQQNDYVKNIQTSFKTQTLTTEDQSQFSNSNSNQEKSEDDFDEFEDFQEAQDNKIEQSEISDYQHVKYDANQEIQNYNGKNFDGEENFGYIDQNNVTQPQNQKNFQSTSDMHTQNVPTQDVQDAQYVEVSEEFENLEETGNSSSEQQPKQTLENKIYKDQVCDEFDDFGEFQEENLVSQQSFQLGQTSQDDAHVQNGSIDAKIDDDDNDGFGDFNENEQFSAFDNQNQHASQNEQNGDDEFGDFDEGFEEAPSDSQNLKHPNQQTKQNIQKETNFDDEYDDFGDFNEGDEAPPSDSQQITSQNQQQFKQEKNVNFDDDDDFGGFNEGDKITSQNLSPQISQQQKQKLNSDDSQQKSVDFDNDDDDFGDFNEGNENQTPTSTPTPQNLQVGVENQSQEKLEYLQQQQQQFQQQQNPRQLNLINMSQNQFSESVNRLFSAVSQNLQKQSTQQIQNFEPNSNIQQISLDSYSNQLINEQQNQLKNLVSSKNSPSTFSSKQHENIKLNWSGSNSENRLLQNLNLTDLAYEAKELETQKQIQQSQRKLKLREKSWKIPTSRRRSKDDQKNNNQNQNININQKNSINQEDSVNKQQRIISNYLKQNSVLPRDSSGDPFAASGPVWNLEADMEGVQGVGSVEPRGGGMVASSSSISAIHDDPFAFIFAGQQQSQTSAFNSGTTVDVSELDDFFSFSVDNTPTASTTQARTDPFATTSQSNTHLDAQLDTLQTVEFGDFSSDKSKELELDAPETSKVGIDKQEELNNLLSSLPDLSFMLSRDVKIQKSSSKK